MGSKRSTPESTHTITITEAQRNIVLGGLYNELLDSERYLSGSDIGDAPSALDSCCAAHLARYEQRKSNYASLIARKTAVEEAIALIEKIKTA